MNHEQAYKDFLLSQREAAVREKEEIWAEREQEFEKEMRKVQAAIKYEKDCLDKIRKVLGSV